MMIVSITTTMTIPLLWNIHGKLTKNTKLIIAAAKENVIILLSVHKYKLSISDLNEIEHIRKLEK